MRLATIGVAVAISMANGPTAFSQEYPDIRGTWMGMSETIVKGETNHFPSESAEEQFEHRLKSIPMTVTIDQQSGRRYAGTVSSAIASEKIVGVVASDGRLLWVDEDGYIQGLLTDQNTMDICYLLVQPDVQLAACAILERQR
ncbi:MAG: hypothetical protein AAF724_20060 [Pseudomonadota bacterium]